MEVPTLKTERLVLRQLQQDDVEIIFFLRSDSSVNQFISRKRATTKQEASDFINRIESNIKEHSSFYWVIGFQSHAIGTICLWNFSADRKTAELGYELHPAFQRQGLMQEAIAAVIAFALAHLQLHTIEAFTNRENQRSISLLEKNGFIMLPHRTDDDPSNAVYQLQNQDLPV